MRQFLLIESEKVGKGFNFSGKLPWGLHDILDAAR